MPGTFGGGAGRRPGHGIGVRSGGLLLVQQHLKDQHGRDEQSGSDDQGRTGLLLDGRARPVVGVSVRSHLRYPSLYVLSPLAIEAIMPDTCKRRSLRA